MKDKILYGNYEGSFEEGEWAIDFTADCTCDYSYYPGRMYMDNGDPGYESETEYDNFDYIVQDLHIFDIEGNEVDENSVDWEPMVKKYMENIDFVDDVNWYDYDYDEGEPPEEEW